MADFSDGKARSAFRTIGEVSEALDIKPHVLRYWEQQFSLLNPLKRSGGRRLYRPSDIEMVEAINRLVNEEGYTLKGAESVLRAKGAGDLDRRKGDRRSSDRRKDDASTEVEALTEVDAPEEAEPVVQAADYSETIAKLKSLRGRLAKAIQA